MGFPKLVRCVDNDCVDGLTLGKIYTAVAFSDVCGEESAYQINIDDDGDALGVYLIERFEDVAVAIDGQPVQKAIDSHYSIFVYTLSEKDKKEGTLKVDPYFVSKQWGLGKKDDTGVLFHCLKNISRYSDKNTKEREIKALYLQVKRLAELENVNLE